MRVAAYARFSSDNQRDASIVDQLRNCGEYAERRGWPDPEAFIDTAITGSRNDRDGYQLLLSRAHEFDVLLLDDLTRFGRDNVELQSVLRRFKFAGLRVIAIADGIDTMREDAKLNVGVRGLFGELFLDDLAKKVHRGQKGRALSGASAGGLPYGYRVTSTGEREIIPEQADVVRRIYADFLAGNSARTIAHQLNHEGVPSPRGSTWAVSAIYGDRQRGIGILANPIYIGRQIWNRSMWIKHPDTGRRIRRERPQSEWVVKDKPELAIVDATTWAAAESFARKSAGNQTKGRKPSALLSGLLRCSECGGPIVATDATYYGCARAKDRGTCSGSIRVPRRKAEAAMLAGVRELLLSESAVKAWQAAVARHLKAQQAGDADRAKRLAQARTERDNVLAAIRRGIITPSTKAELERLEAVVVAMETEGVPETRMMPDVRGRLRRMADSLADQSAANPAVRAALKAVIGTAVLEKKNGATVARFAPLDLQTNVVAGVGFEPTTFGL